MDPVIYEQSRSKMARTGMAFGVAALVSSIIFFTMPFVAMGFAGFGILFTVLSKGNLPKLAKEGHIAIATSLVALLVSVGILVSVFSALKNNPDYRKNVVELMSSVYGEDFETVYGISVEDALNETLGQ